MHIFQKATILFSFWGVLSSIAVAKPQVFVTITGNVIHRAGSTPKVLGFNFLNPFENVRKNVTLDSRSRFSIKGRMRFAQNMTIAYNDTFINLYVAPGDSVHIDIDAALLDKSDFQWLKISGDHAQLSSQLNLLHDAISKLPYKKYDYSVSVPVMLDAVKNDYERYLAFMTEYEKSHPLDPTVHSFFLKDIKFSISNLISDYVDKGSNSSSDRAGRINLFRDPFFAINDESNFVTMMYPYHLANFQYWKISEDSTVARAKRVGKNREALLGGIELIQTFSTASLSKDYMIFNYIESFFKRAPSLTDSLPSIKTQFFDAGTYAYFERASERAKTINLPQTLISKVRYLRNGRVSNTANTDLIELLTKKYSGKVIYLDIYATWCIPCLKEMEYAPEIHQQFTGQDVVFVNLCMQSDENKWKALISNRKLQGEQYFLTADDTKLLMGSYNISGFPTYMLINRSGHVTTVNPPRPSESQRLKQEIQKLLLTDKN